MIFLVSVLGMALTLHLWIQKERNFDQGCWGAGAAAPASHVAGCQDERLANASKWCGVSVAGLGYLFFLAMALLSFSKNIVPPKWEQRCHGVASLLVGSALPIALYFVGIQIEAQAYCPLCLLTSALILTLFGLYVSTWRRASVSPTPEPLRRREVGYASGIVLAGGGLTVAMLLFVDQIGIRRLDAAAEARQIEAVMEQALPRLLPAAQLAMPRSRSPGEAPKRLKLEDWVDSMTPALGKPGGVDVVFFLDPNCPTCQGSFAIFLRLAEKYRGSARFYLLGRPLWDYSILQISALELAKASGKYFELWQAQFDHQKRGGMVATDIAVLYKNLGLNSTDLSARLDSAYPAVFDLRAKAQSAGINSTPTVFVDSEFVGAWARTEANLGRLIEQAAAKRSPKSKAQQPEEKR